MRQWETAYEECLQRYDNLEKEVHFTRVCVKLQHS